MKYLSLLLATLFIFSCNPSSDTLNQQKTTIDDSFGNYISSYTPEMISVKQDIMMRFASDVAEKEDVGLPIPAGMMTFSPKIKGEAVWKDRSTIVFTPSERLEYNSTYFMTMNIKDVFSNVPADQQEIKIPYLTKGIEYSISTRNISYGNSEDNLLVLNGEIRTSDFSDDSAIEKLLQAYQKGNNKLDISWDHISSKRHGFTISNIVRSAEKSTLSLTWNDKINKTDFEGKKDITIHGLGAFELASSSTSKGNERKINLAFTRALDRSQSLDGLIRIKDYAGKFKYDIIGNELAIYPQSKVESPFEITIDEAVKDTKGGTLKSEFKTNLSFDAVKPSVRLAGKGVIVPYSDAIIFPFEAINLQGATVEVYKIFQDNVLQFLQYSNLESTYNLHPVGRIVHQEDIKLMDYNSDPNDANYVRYALNLKEMITPDPGAIYQIRIGFSKKHVAGYDCDEEVPEAAFVSERDGFTSIFENNFRSSNWEDRKDPCKRAYYNSSKFIKRNVLASNIGIIAKKEQDKSMKFVLSDLRNVDPLSGAEVSVFDFQQQEISSGKTGADGMLDINLERNAAFAIVRHGADFGYINVGDPQANSLSEFEVSGSAKKGGIDGYIYGERGVWRPGDTMHLNFVLEDKMQTLPSNHPVTLIVKDARGKQKYKTTTTKHLGHVYSFPVLTGDKDPTGNWTATVKVGKNTFGKTLKVETVKPNRLKIEYNVEQGESIKLYNKNTIALTSKWLHGASADGLKSTVTMQLSPTNTSFKGYSEYIFDDPARKIDAQPFQVYQGTLDENGKADIPLKINPEWRASGKLRVNFNSKVFEKGGNFSEDNFSREGDMYGSYVGIKIPKTRWGSKFIKRNESTDIPIVVVDKEGKPVKNRSLSVGLYTANWNWWYNRGYNSRYNYNSAKHNGAVSKKSLKTNNKGEAYYNVKFEDYGNYMVRVCDDETGHCTGDLFYTGYSWAQRGEDDEPQKLLFTTDKKAYKLGEDIDVSIPSSSNAKVFLSIENGQEVLQSFWLDTKENETKISIPTDASMSANVYIHAHMVQPHNDGENDLPMRMYGVVPISVVDPATELAPKIAMAESLKPNEDFLVTISEDQGKPMVYTLAVVDEGLLDLTRFKTPDLWNKFYAKQALGVKTWDIYDYVLGGYGGVIDKLISIGGDAANVGAKKDRKANRFEPVVRHLGPFRLEAGSKKTHTISMPNYVGSVRTMVVAREGESYGKAEKATPVKKPLMVLATLPRVLGPGESLDLPANVFAMENHVKNVNVSVETSSNLTVSNGDKKQVSFDKIGDRQAYFTLDVGQNIGDANVNVRANGNGEGAYDEVNINIRNANPYTSEVFESAIQPGTEWTKDYALFGTPGTNEGVIELSRLPSLDFGRRLRYLVRYPYGCLEQTTSSVFPQLYLADISELSENRKERINRNIMSGIQRLSRFQLGNGGMAYWPGNQKANEWGTNYAMHFLVEAKAKGFFVPDELLSGLISYQDKAADNELLSQDSRTKAYRLYVLARAGSPNIGAMNRLRNEKNLGVTSVHILAAAYALIGKKNIAKNMIENKDTDIKPYRETGNTYGSEVRDLAMIAEAQQIIGNDLEAAKIIKILCDRLSSSNWYSTQSTSYALLSVGKFLLDNEKDDLNYEYAINGGNSVKGSTQKSMVQATIDVENGSNKKLKVKNTSKGIMYVRYVLSGQLPPGAETQESSKHIDLDVKYTDMNGKIINPESIKQGTDFKAVVKVKNLGSRGRNINEIALSQIFPSGWEIQNARMSAINENDQSSRYEYRNIRDDRVYTFFDIRGRSEMTFSVTLNATYAGKFYLSPVYAEAMYDNEIQARTKGRWVQVVR